MSLTQQLAELKAKKLTIIPEDTQKPCLPTWKDWQNQVWSKALPKRG